MNIKQIRTFLPSIDFEISKQFYLDMGFTLRWDSPDLVIFGDDHNNFFLQKYYQKDWAENLMMQLHVDDLEGLYTICEKLISKYEGTKIKPIFTADYGRTFHIIDPAGVLWHMTEFTVKEDEIEDQQSLLCDDEKK